MSRKPKNAQHWGSDVVDVVAETRQMVQQQLEVIYTLTDVGNEPCPGPVLMGAFGVVEAAMDRLGHVQACLNRIASEMFAEFPLSGDRSPYCEPSDSLAYKIANIMGVKQKN